MMKSILKIFVIIISILATACSSSSPFKLKGDMTDKRDQTLRLVMYSPDGVHTEVTATRSGHFEYSRELNKDALPTYIEIYTHDYKLLGIVAVSAGDEVEIELDPKDFKNFRVKDTTEESFNGLLSDWLVKTKKIDNEAVASFIKEHPTSAVSLALLSTVYNATENMDDAYELLRSIESVGRPAYYDGGFLSMMQQYGDASKEVVEGKMLCNADTLLDFKPKDYKKIFIAFTPDNPVRADSVVPLLNRLAKTAKNSKAMVMEHNLSNDTLAWKRTLRGDKLRFESADTLGRGKEKVNWVSVWTGPGPAAAVAREYAIPILPFFIVADSTGAIVYRGSSASIAAKKYETIKY